MGSLTLRPGDLLTLLTRALSIGFISFVSSTNAIQATGPLTLTPVGLTPTEHPSLSWTHVGSRAGAVARWAPFPTPASSNAACGFPALRFPAQFMFRVMRPIDREPLSTRDDSVGLDNH